MMGVQCTSAARGCLISHRAGEITKKAMEVGETTSARDLGDVGESKVMSRVVECQRSKVVRGICFYMMILTVIA